MTRTKFQTVVPSPSAHGVRTAPSPTRRAATWALLAASAALDRLAQRLAWPIEASRPQDLAELEFYAQAGAPEGALYVNGEFVGWLQGVKRL